MGKRSGVPDTDEALAKMSNAELSAEISRVRSRLTIPNRPLLIKLFKKRLHWLEKAQAQRQA